MRDKISPFAQSLVKGPGRSFILFPTRAYNYFSDLSTSYRDRHDVGLTGDYWWALGHGDLSRRLAQAIAGADAPDGNDVC